MGVQFTPQESSALYGLLAEDTGDMILKTDREAFIVHASPPVDRRGFPLANELFGPHLLDLVHPSAAGEIRAKHDAVINGRPDGSWVEFPAQSYGAPERWFEIQMRALTDDHGRTYGALSIMRSIEERRSFEKQLFVASMTDPLTGLTNRRAFIQMLRHIVEARVGGCLAIFDIDHFKAINMKYGQTVGDEVLVVFAELVRTLMRAEDIISRIGSESLGVLLPHSTPDSAQAICQRIVAALAEIGQAQGAHGFAITASAGLAPITGSLDNTIKDAEQALTLAKAKGRNRIETASRQRLSWLPTRRFW
ncbi:MAG TPA: sensor domain-containing diguanylate cyclase [Novosphingobium sp.]|nr:sensor domain-containing diguanylate cyclase [Novosphingobium sp.]